VTAALSGSAASAYDVAAGWVHTCAIDNNGVTCWGRNNYGQSTVPAGLINPTGIAAGDGHTCAIDDNGMTCWGRNDYDQSTVPAGLINPIVIAAGGFHTCAIDDNEVTCWGRNDYGQSTLPGLSFTTCGNGVVEPGLGEQCEPVLGGVCCSSNCQFESTSVVCRPAAGICDMAESCDGVATDCPADAFCFSHNRVPSLGGRM
jgi:alpha-tubulin suppressor-like RCC1 family protein